MKAETPIDFATDSEFTAFDQQPYSDAAVYGAGKKAPSFVAVVRRTGCFKTTSANW